MIPKGWKLKKLDDVCTISSGGTPSKIKPEYWNGDIPWISASTMHQQYITSSDLFISEEGLTNGSRLANEGDILLLVRGSMLWNRIPICICKKDVAFNQDVKSIKANKETTSLFLFYCLLSKENVLLNEVVGTGIGAGKLETNELKALPISLPPFTEQQKIISILSVWDEAIEKQTKLIEKLELRKKGLMQQLLTGKKRIAGFNNKWKKYLYSELLKEIKRKTIWDDDYLYDLVSVKRRSGGIFFRGSIYGRDIKTKNLRPVEEGDFLISKMQILHGASGLTTKEFAGMMISGSYIALIAKEPEILDIKYFNWISKMPYFYHQTYISSYGVHIEKMTFDFETFLSQSIRIPSIEEQKLIVDVLEENTNNIKVQERKLSKLNQQKKALMQQLLTGKTRVNN